MIQRIQTIWLLLASLCSFLTLKFPFYSGSTLLTPHVELTAEHTVPLLILTVVTATLALVAVFLFKNRKVQMRLALVGLLVQLGCLALYFSEINKFTQGNFALWSVLSFASVIFYIMALAGINRDQKLVKSLDRLR